MTCRVCDMAVWQGKLPYFIAPPRAEGDQTSGENVDEEVEAVEDDDEAPLCEGEEGEEEGNSGEEEVRGKSGQ